MSSLYSQFKTNKSLEKEGVVIQYGVNSEGKPIEFLVARAGGSNTKYLKALEAATRPYRKQIQNDLIDRETIQSIMQRVFATTVVLGWENVEDEDGKPIKFSVENCIKLFSDLPDLFSDIQEQSQRVSIYKEELKEEDLKN